jgi:DNA-binding NtrC family response regulator/predicted hydrocarbon binding protein
MNKKLPPVPSNKDLKKLIRFEDESGYIWLGQQRMILLHASAFGSLRKEIIESFGEEYAKGVLKRMGYASALSDAQLARELRSDKSLLDMFMVGPQLHNLEGVVSVEPVSVELDEKGGDFHGEFIWNNSFEAAEHLRLFGVSNHSVCWQLEGYASGYTSSLMGKPIYYKEVECVGKGDAQCRIIGKPLDEWEDAEELQSYYSLNSMATKLDILEAEVQDYREEKSIDVSPANIIADSPPIKDIMFLLGKAAATNVSVLMLGETGVGKEVFSQALHKMGKRKDKPFIAINCAAIPDNLVESELFGVEKGGFTGADKSRPGRFERAHGGTLFLDELGELDEQVQSKLLRVIQTGELERVGGKENIKVDVRIIAATNANLDERVKEGTFRADLYYRLNVFPITIPPLRERYSDIPGLVNKFIKRYNKRHGKEVLGVTDEVMQKFSTYHWPGNIRELENLIERGVILTDNNNFIESTIICIGMPESQNQFMSLDEGGNLAKKGKGLSLDNLLSLFAEEGMSFSSLEAHILKAALSKNNGNVEKTARLLGITGPQCRYRLKKAGLI